MSILDDTAIFAAVIQQGGFSHAAKHLGLSNGLISRRIAKLESELGVALIKRTTRQLQLTPEGELLWQHAQRIQQELDAALSLIHSLAQKPKGGIRVSAPVYIGRHYLAPIIFKFMQNFKDIQVDLILTNQRLDPVKHKLDLTFRGSGYFAGGTLKDSTLVTRLLLKQKIGIYASPDYLAKQGEPTTPDQLAAHAIIGYADAVNLPEHEAWACLDKNKKKYQITVNPVFSTNDIESTVLACTTGIGIAKLTELAVKNMTSQQVRAILQPYDWGEFNLFAVYPQQASLPKRTRMLLDFVSASLQRGAS